MSCHPKDKLKLPIFVISLIIFLVGFKIAYAETQKDITATVKISVCGNHIKETGEDCDHADLGGKTCISLGFASGSLACDIACSFDISSCSAPTINPNNVGSSDTSSLLAAGYFTKPSSSSYISTSSLTVANQITINVPVSGGTCSVTLPKDVVITESGGDDFDPTSLVTASVATSALSGFSQNTTVQAALQWGIANTTLTFDNPISLSIYVGTSLNGQTLNVVRSTSLDSGWTSDGIVPPATCVVNAGTCTFQATKASYYATTSTISTPTPTTTPTATPTPTATATTESQSSSSSTSTTTSTSTPATLTPIPTQAFALPKVLTFFDNDGSGTIEVYEIFTAIEKWVNEWRVDKPSSEKNCDVNGDRKCDIFDFSVLLYYIERRQ